MTIQVKKSEITEIRNVESDAFLPTESGNFRIAVTPDDRGMEHALLYVEGFSKSVNPLVRIHSECLTGDAFHSLKCDCGAQLKKSMELIQKEGAGAIVYLRQEGRGIGLESKIQAYALQDRGYDTLDANLALGLPADARDYEIAATMLKKKSVTSVRLMTNNPLKVKGLRDNGIRVSDRVSHISGLCESNRDYLNTKKARMGHLLDLD
ncbi:MAG: GTP cyclohydrolase II [Candidatus Poseidoniales archaeon]|jgi:GTP cyclohydrolase II|uniref:GTP cyclohydrolase-2 n=1 Tax=uncultured Poseidoniia archaeon TaxID=1697135 RepID=A0A1B1T9Z9_9ARCH|nr:GTP cyclohydrolase II (ribA, RIB1) [uncultured Candidatus Thalassoarchaea sp.]RCH75929.1 MAG: GTP cyclohydrolase II [Candidatus Poseidoniales archaeon]